MTTIAAGLNTDVPTADPVPSRVWAAFRMQFLVRHTFIYVPIMIFLGTWIAAIGVGALIELINDFPTSASAPVYGGVSQASVWALLAMAAYSVSHTMPFAMALSFSRRAYVLGTLLAFVVVAAAYGLLYTGAALVESATNGFGIHHYHFALPFLIDNGGYPGAGFLAFAVVLSFMLVGFLGASVYRRFSMLTFWAAGILALLSIAIILVLLSRLVGWDSMWQWLLQQSTLSFGGWLILVSAVIAAVSYTVLRKATPAD